MWLCDNNYSTTEATGPQGHRDKSEATMGEEMSGGRWGGGLET